MTTRRVLSPVPWLDIRVLPGSEEAMIMESWGKDEAWRRSQIQDLTLTTARLIRERSNSQIIHLRFIGFRANAWTLRLPVLGQGSILSRSSADAGIEPVTEPLGLEGLLPDERLGVRLRQPHLRRLGEEMPLQG
jgi:hypothetical protein